MALSFNSENNFRTIPVGIAEFGAQFTIPYGTIFAASTVAAVPIAILVLVFRKCRVRPHRGGGQGMTSPRHPLCQEEGDHVGNCRA